MAKELTRSNFPHLSSSTFYFGYPMPDSILGENTNVEDLMLVGSIGVSPEDFCEAVKNGEYPDLQFIKSIDGCDWSLTAFERFTNSNTNAIHEYTVALYYSPVIGDRIPN